MSATTMTKKKVVLKIVKKLPAPAPAPAPEKKDDWVMKVVAEQAKWFAYERKHKKYWEERVEKRECEKCGAKHQALLAEVNLDEDAIPEFLLCMSCNKEYEKKKETEKKTQKEAKERCDEIVKELLEIRANTETTEKKKKVRTYCFGCETDAGEPVVKCVDCDEDVCVECCGSSFPLNGKTAMKCIKCETLVMNDGGGLPDAEEGEHFCFICASLCEPEDGEYVGDEDVVCNDCGMLREFDDVRDGWVATKWAIEKIMKYKRGGLTMSGAIEKVMAY